MAACRTWVTWAVWAAWACNSHQRIQVRQPRAVTKRPASAGLFFCRVVSAPHPADGRDERGHAHVIVVDQETPDTPVDDEIGRDGRRAFRDVVLVAVEIELGLVT